MAALSDQIVQMIESEFCDVTFLELQWPQIKATLAAQYRTVASVEAQEAVLTTLLQSLQVSRFPEHIDATAY